MQTNSENLYDKIQKLQKETVSYSVGQTCQILKRTQLLFLHEGARVHTPNKVRRQISIAMIALIMHVPAKDWGSGGHLKQLKKLGSHYDFF